MEDALQTAFAKCSERKEKYAKRKLQKGSSLVVLEPGDQILIRSLTPRRGPGHFGHFGNKT